MPFLQGLLALGLLAPAHSNSQSSSRVTVDGEWVQLELRCQALSLFEVVPELDGNSDGLLTPTELQATAGPTAEYLYNHYRLWGDGSALTPEQGSLQLVAPDPRALFPEPQWVDLTVQFRAAPPVDALEIEATLFHGTSPDHRDFAQVRWSAAEPRLQVLDRFRPRARWQESAARDARPATPVQRGAAHFLRLGLEHILTGWDHLAFLLALLLAAQNIRSLLWVVTAFTASHSLSLALASFGWVRVPANLVEIAIALSIAYVGADNLLFPKQRAKWPEAFVFGLIHGLGFASFVGDSLLAESSKVWALLAFNLGVELGQVAVVLAAVLLLKLLAARIDARRSPGLIPPGVRRPGSLLVLGLGLCWFVQRAWL